MNHTKSTEWHLDPMSMVPLHLQFEQQIKERVQSGEWRPGDRIPSERELMQLANISRATVRQALTSLVHQQILERIHGSGTFVRHPKYEQSLQILYSFSEQLRSLGIILRDEILTREIIEATPEIAQHLHLNLNDPVIHLRRLRFLREVPMMVSIAYIPARLCPGLINETFDQSLYRLLTERYQRPVLQATDRLEAVPADQTIAMHLNVAPGTPLMYVERIATTHDNVRLHLGYNYIRGDMCRFRSDMDAQPTSLELKSP